jgi:hypothetical protein
MKIGTGNSPGKKHIIRNTNQPDFIPDATTNGATGTGKLENLQHHSSSSAVDS